MLKVSIYKFTVPGLTVTAATNNKENGQAVIDAIVMRILNKVQSIVVENR